MGFSLFRAIRALLFIYPLLSATLLPTIGLSDISEERVDLSSPRQIESVFLQGLRFISEDQARKAVVLFRKILARNSNLPRVRLELARAYFLIESWSESRAEFVTVLSGDIPSPVRKNVLRFIRAIDARRGFDWSAAVGISLNPEAGRDYKTDIVELDFFGTKLPFEVERERKDVIGLRFEGSAEIRRGLLDFAGGPSVVGFFGTSANFFEAKGSTYDDYVFSGNAGSRFVWPQTTAIAAINTSVRYKSGEIHEERKGLSGNIEFRSARGFSPFLSASYSDVNVHETQAQDGDLYGFGAGFSKSVLGFANVGVVASFERFDANESYESYQTVGLSAVGQAEVGFGIGALARARIRQRDYQAKIPLFPKKRDDLELSIDIELVKNDVLFLSQFSPFVRVGYTYNQSSIDIFTYNEYRLLVGVKNAF